MEATTGLTIVSALLSAVSVHHGCVKDCSVEAVVAR